MQCVNFTGVAAIVNPQDSWIARWLGRREFLPIRAALLSRDVSKVSLPHPLTITPSGDIFGAGTVLHYQQDQFVCPNVETRDQD